MMKQKERIKELQEADTALSLAIATEKKKIEDRRFAELVGFLSEAMSSRLGEILEGFRNDSRISKNEIISSVKEGLTQNNRLGEIMNNFRNDSKFSNESITAAIKEGLSQIKIPEFPAIPSPTITVNPPEVNVTVPEVRVPTPQVNVTVPEIKVPKIQAPDVKFELPTDLTTKLSGVDLKHPVPVVLVDPTEDRPYIAGGGGGPRTMSVINTPNVKNLAIENTGITLTAINTTYNNTTTSANSADLTTTGYRTCDLIFTVVSANTPTDITFDAEAKDGSTYFKMKNGFLGKFIFDDTAVATAQNIHVTFPCPASGTMRITVTATGTTALNTFTVSNAKIFLRT